MEKEFKIGDIVAFTGKDYYLWSKSRNKTKGKISKIDGDWYYVVINNNESFEPGTEYGFRKTWIKKQESRKK